MAGVYVPRSVTPCMKSNDKRQIPCPACHGTGQLLEYRTDLDDLGPDSQAEFLLCEECHGTGKIEVDW